MIKVISKAGVPGIFTCCFCKTVVLVLLYALSVQQANAEKYFRLGTGGNGGTYLPIGSLIANAINKQQIKADDGKVVVVLPQRSNGSVANLKDISDNLLEGGLAQADTVSHIFQSDETYSGGLARDNLRTVGTLFLESVHLVVAADSGIESVADMIGKRVSVDELGSGTQMDVEPLLAAYGSSFADYQIIYLKPDDSIDRMRRGTLDAFFVIAGFPLAGITQLVDDGVGHVIGFKPEVIDRLENEFPYFSSHTIPAGVYANDTDILTLSVPAQMIVRTDVDEEVVYQMTKTLWCSNTLSALASGHPRGADMNSETALTGIGIPLHKGAERYYQERGFQHD